MDHRVTPFIDYLISVYPYLGLNPEIFFEFLLDGICCYDFRSAGQLLVESRAN